MNKLLYFICLWCMPISIISSQATDNLNNSSQSSKEPLKQTDFAASKVFRNQVGTYVKLKWDQNVEKSTYTVLLKDEDGQEYAFQSTGTSITIKYLEVPKTYYWTVLGLENDVQFTKQFSTAYGDASVSWELSNLLSTWEGTVKEGMDLETFLRKNGRHIDPEELETFIYTFYEGVPPSLFGGVKSDNCRCTMVASDDFVLGGENYSSHNEPYSTEFCGWWWRENSYTKSRGASKDLSLSLRGRLKENQHKSYTINNYETATTSRVHYICEGEDCCGANINYGLRYETEVNADGKYEKNGSYISMAADMAFFSEITSDGDITLLGNPIAVAVEMSESTTINIEFWNEILDLVVPAATLAYGLFQFDTITDIDSLNLLSGLGTLIDEVKDVIGTKPIIHLSEGDNGAFEQGETNLSGLCVCFIS